MAEKMKYKAKEIVSAQKMSCGEYYKLMRFDGGQEYTDAGYLVEFLCEFDERNHPDFFGYIIWLPQSVFESSFSVFNVDHAGSVDDGHREPGILEQDELDSNIETEMIRQLKKLNALIAEMMAAGVKLQRYDYFPSAKIKLRTREKK